MPSVFPLTIRKVWEEIHLSPPRDLRTKTRDLFYDPNSFRFAHRSELCHFVKLTSSKCFGIVNPFKGSGSASGGCGVPKYPKYIFQYVYPKIN